MVVVNEQVQISDAELDWSYARSGGPGGQNVNKVASKAILHWDATNSPALPEWVRLRFLALNKTRITTEGVLVLQSQRFRDQEKNRQDCIDKLTAMLLQACDLPTVRRATKPTKSSNRRRLNDKKANAATKAGRKSVSPDA